MRPSKVSTRSYASYTGLRRKGQRKKQKLTTTM